MKNVFFNRRVVPIIAIGVLTCMPGLGSLCAQDGFKPKFGSDNFAKIEYPAQGNVELNEGTYEIWCQVNFEPLRKTSEYYSPMTFLSIGGGSEGNPDERKNFLAGMYRQTYMKDVNTHGSDIYIGSSYFSRFGMSAQSSNLAWKKGDWHHLTITWKREDKTYDFAFYCDGKKFDKVHVTLEKEIPALGNNWVIRVGAEWLNSCYGTINAIKISSVALTEEEIAKNAASKLEADRFTLLLDTFNKVEKNDKQNGVTIPERGIQGKIIGSFETKDGKFGPAVKLNVVEE